MLAETKVGIIFPVKKIGTEGSKIRDLAAATEHAGFNFLIFYDHVILGSVPEVNNKYSRDIEFHEPFTLMAHIAAVTKRIHLITGVVVLPQRQTALVAKQATEVQNLSDGRLELGVGVGTNKTEFKAMGISNTQFHRRGKRMEEQIQVLRELWTNELVTETLDQESFTNVGINPLPIKKIPIWIGGGTGSEMGGTVELTGRVLRRVAHLGDGWIPMSHPQSVRPYIETLRGMLSEAGRDPQTFPIMGAFGRRLGISTATNELQEFATVYKNWQQLGVSHVAFGTMGQGYGTDVDSHINRMKQFASIVKG